MLGMWGSYSSKFLFVLGPLMALIFGIPMAFWPLKWAKMLRWEIPAEIDLAVYFGRCLGCLAIACSALAVVVAMNPAAQPFIFQFFLLFTIFMVVVHIYGAVKKIQPITETYEIGFWVLLVLLNVMFWPTVPA